MRKSSPSWSILSKQKPRSPSITPGPGDYSTQLSEPSKFAVSTSIRPDIQKADNNPGPGSYSPVAISNSPVVR